MKEFIEYIAKQLVDKPEKITPFISEIVPSSEIDKFFFNKSNIIFILG